jgi:hypothetical protein
VGNAIKQKVIDEKWDLNRAASPRYNAGIIDKDPVNKATQKIDNPIGMSP